jgi:hypothetical protein
MSSISHYDKNPECPSPVGVGKPRPSLGWRCLQRTRRLSIIELRSLRVSALAFVCYCSRGVFDSALTLMAGQQRSTRMPDRIGNP